MPPNPINIKARVKTLHAVLVTKKDQRAVEKALQADGDDIPAALSKLKGKISAASLQRLTLAHSLAETTGDNPAIIKQLTAQPNVKSLRDVALHFNVKKLAALVKVEDLSEDVAGTTPRSKAKNFATALHTKLFLTETSAVLQRMVQDAEVPIADMNLRTGVASFFNNQPGYNIRTTSIYTALKHPEAFKGIDAEHRAGVVESLKTLQRVQAISPVPEVVPSLMKANLTSAFRVAAIPESTFLKAYSGTLGAETALQVYTNAINSHIRNEHALVTMRETMKGTGLAIIDGKQNRDERVAAAQKVADEKAVPLNLSTLFGSMDYCECEECLSVYSPAAYFVELLQFLRNNNLGPNPAIGDPDPAHNKNIHPGIIGTPLEKLFRRRPDLGCLELTCENTFTVLPYIDLVNEVMESFVVHLSDYHLDTNVPKQATLEAFNVEGETSSELLAIPQHINYEAYCILKSAVYPFTLPYHQPIDATRIFLDYLGTSRWELLDTFRSPTESCPDVTLTADQLKELQALHQAVIDRAVDAEYLGLTQEEYIILTREAFWPIRYFDLTQHKTFSVAEYEKNIGVRQICEYYGYVAPANGSCDPDMLSTDESAEVGLTFVKKQFLPRTGILYTDLVELLKTRFINPNFPQGKALTLLESIRFSYRFLQTLVNASSTDPKIRFAKLIAFLDAAQPLVPLLDARLHPDLCQQQKLDTCVDESKDFRNWVYCYFDRIGKLIVLESGEGPHIPIEGDVFAGARSIGVLRNDGTIRDKNGVFIGCVTATGTVVGRDGKLLVDMFPVAIMIKDEAGKTIGFIRRQGLQGLKEDPLGWIFTRETCDLDKVRLIHLDGSSVTADEYDRIQRFIRLWRKVDWTIDETDKALTGLASGHHAAGGGGTPSGAGGDGPSGTLEETPTGPQVCENIGFDTFVDDCSPRGGGDGGDCQNGGDQGGMDRCPEIEEVDYTITPNFLHQLRAIKKLLDQTGLPLPKLLTLWAEISTDGEKSLYSKLFLTHNLLGIDKVFKADANGNYLTQSVKITDHLPVLMAALRLKADDITAVMSFGPVADSLTLHNVSVLYRYSLLAKILHVRISLLKDVTDLFGKPFQSAWTTLGFLETWGKMEDAGFTFRQLDYLILGRDDVLRPLAPSQRTILQLAKTLFDGLNAIDHDHPDITEENKGDATTDLIRAKTGLVFEPAVVEQTVALLEGTTLYTTNAPTGLKPAFSDKDTLSTKLKYFEQKGAPPTASIQATGILTEPEITRAKALSNHPKWAGAIDRVGKQKRNFFNDVLFGIFPNKVEADKNLLAGDFNNPNDSQDDANTAPTKRLYFLKIFLPFLREQLSQRLIVDTAGGAASLPSDVTNELLSDILHVGTPQVSAMKALEAIKIKAAGAPAGWQGYLIPLADADFTFVAIGDTQPPSLTLDGQSIPFTVQQEDPSNVWSGDPTKPAKLKSGKLYWLQVTDRSADELLWKTATSPSAKIPSASLLPDFSQQTTSDVFTKLYKAALLVNGFNLSADEVSFWQKNAANFDGFDFNKITLLHWKRLQAYVDLRNKLPRTETTLLDLFKWASQPTADPAKLSGKIAAATTWKQESVDKLIAPDANNAKDHFDLNHPALFRNEVNLIRLRQAIGVAEKIAVDIDRLFEWAKPGSKFWVCHQIAEDIRKATRARFDQEDWEKVVKPLNDRLREHQKAALIDYLLVQPDLIDWGVIDADSLFEFFLIDVQMDACMETSRIKQAISSTQLFIQRCQLGLEERKSAGLEVGVRNDDIDRQRWTWMQRYRLWEANRKVFLYPENWILSELRDDKSAFFTELESELLQKDISPRTVEEALKNYLFKVDEIANLKVAGLFVEAKPQRLHVFARTRNAPFLFYYRKFDVAERNWYPWEKMQVDIPTYDVEDKTTTKILDNGSYIVPTVWNGRLLAFFPQFLKKTSSDPTVGEFWEIKLGWSEYRNNKWTQKQVSADAVYTFVSAGKVFSGGIDLYSFIPRAVTAPDNRLLIEVYFNANNDIGKFAFTGNHLFVDPAALTKSALSTIAHFQVFHADKSLHSYQATGTSAPALVATEPFFVVDDIAPTGHLGGPLVEFSHPFIRDLINAVSTGGLDDLFGFLSKKVAGKSNAFGGYLDADGKPAYAELKAAYSIYNWEAGFHAPMLLATRLSKALQFERAVEVCHHVMNPYAAGVPTDARRFWQFWPFTQVSPDNVLENLFLSLKPGTPNAAINEWRDKPFQPHVVARGRPVAYMKWVAMTYIGILIDWGDHLFRQDTIESINQATQLYVLAAHTYGARGQEIPRRGQVAPATYNSLLDRWDAFGNAMVELELAFPFSNQTPLDSGSSNGVVGLANIFGFATTLYFCIPDNPQLTALRDTIDDRLFKIRHCENIEGVFRHLPLFEPPIDPALLVEATAQGLSLSSVLDDLSSPMPNYRFHYLMQKALELCNELKVLSAAFLSAKEKADGEALARLRAGHESTIHRLVMEVRTKQLEEANRALVGLEQSRRGPAYRLQHYQRLLGESGGVPDPAADFKEIADPIEAPIDDSGLKLVAYEKEEIDKAIEANDKQQDVGTIEVLAGILHAVPNLGFPLGPVTTTFGGSNLGSAAQAVARSNQIVAGNRAFSSTNAGRKASFLRQLQERVQQANVAGYEIKSIDKQTLTQRIRIDIAQQEIDNQQKQIDNAQQVEDFLHDKYTNQELHAHSADQLSGLCYQTYTLLHNMASRLGKVFKFERGTTDFDFKQLNTWDPAYDGLLAAERMYTGLKHLEAAYQEKRGYDFEIVKNISLQQLNPLALIQLRETGTCEFALPEVLFDMGYPGHYMRRIKSVALTFACHVGPPTSLNCVLRLLEHKFRTNAIVNGKSDYAERTDETDDRFSTVNVPITAVAVSMGQNDSGVFELNFRDERYVPFEGAGAISRWRIELPEKFREYDYDSITTVDMKLFYTALDGGDKLRTIAAASVEDYVKSVEVLGREEGLFALFDLRHDFPNEWYKGSKPPAGATERAIALDSLLERLPIFTKGTPATKILANDVYVFTTAALPAATLKLVQGTDEFQFNDSPAVGTKMKSFVAKDVGCQLKGWKIKISDVTTTVDQLWLVLRYTLGQ